MPLFDTDEPDLNWIELFRTNRYAGLDRISDANQISLGVTTQVYSSSSGARILSTTIGQTFNFQTPRVRLPDEPPDAGNASDLIAQIELHGLSQLEHQHRRCSGTPTPIARSAPRSGCTTSPRRAAC